MLRRVEVLGMKEKRDVDYGSRTNKLRREQKVLKKTMTGEELASVMALVHSRHGVIKTCCSRPNLFFLLP